MVTTPPDVITAGRIELRRRTLDDDDAMVDAIRMSLDHLRPWMPWAAQEPTVEAQHRVVADADTGWLDGSQFVYGVYESASGELVGGAGLHRRVGPGSIEIGYWVRADRTRRGYARLAAGALTRAALGLAGVGRVEIHCDQANVASAAVPRSLGYRLDRIEDSERLTSGDSGRSMVWLLTAADHPADHQPAGRRPADCEVVDPSAR